MKNEILNKSYKQSSGTPFFMSLRQAITFKETELWKKTIKYY